MSYLFFIDESGHDHNNCPYEVRGGFVIDINKAWSFLNEIRNLEIETFGSPLSRFKSEIKGAKLLKKKIFKNLDKETKLEYREQKRFVRSFLEKGKRNESPVRKEFIAYSNACTSFVHCVFN